MGTPIAPADLTWLLMDRPNNLMHVHGLMTFDRPPGLEELEQAIFDRLVLKYRVLSQRPVCHHGHWEWEDDPGFDIGRHVRRVVLDDFDPQALRDFLSPQLSVPFDREHPLWEAQLITGRDDGDGGALFTRFHHGLGDGIRLVQVLLGMCDSSEGATPVVVGRESPDLLQTTAHVTEQSLKDAVDVVAHAPHAAVQAGRALTGTLNPLRLPHQLETAVGFVRNPVKLTDALTSFTDDDNELSNSWREISRMLLTAPAEAGAWTGHPGGVKAVDWIEGVSLAQVRQAAETLGGTINDVLVAAVSLALTHYLRERGVSQVHDLGWLMPVSLQPMDASLPPTLGNHFSVVLFSMPLGVDDPAELVSEVHHRTTRIKRSAEPALAFGVQRVIADSPRAVADRLTDFFSSKTIGQLTNVPGPRVQLSLAGAPVRSVLGWVPTQGDQPLGICLFSYRGTVSAGISVDTRMIPDPGRITTLVQEHLERLVAVSHADRSYDAGPTGREGRDVRELATERRGRSRRPRGGGARAETGRRLVVANISLSSNDWDYDEEVTFAGHDFRLVRAGVSGDLAAAEELLWRWSLTADAIAVTGAQEAKAAGLFAGEVRSVKDLVGAAARVPVTDGTMLADVLQEWAVRRVDAEMPGYFMNARTVVLGGASHARTINVLREFTPNIDIADPALRETVPAALVGNPVVERAAELGMLAWRMTPGTVKDHTRAPSEWVSHRLARRAARDCDVIVGSYDELLAFDLEELAGKAVVTSAVSDTRLAELGRRGVDLVVDGAPRPFPFMVVTAMFEAMAQAMLAEDRELTADDLLEFVQTAGIEPRLLRPNGPRRKSRFAFVIHPLSQEFFANVEPLGTLAKVPGMSSAVEKAIAYSPPFVYSHVTGIRSPTGAEAEGWLITVGGTPKEMLAHSPEFTYSRLLAAAEIARKLGAQVMGLGAFTKVVGDAGLTVAKQAPLPVTTGNSYSASGALWAAHEAVRRLGLLQEDEDGRLRGKTMVVGATGAIGSVCARLLALASDELWLVSPETAKLLALKEDIERERPRSTVHVAARAEDALADMDVIVTATSAAGKKILDIMKVKPGCVITDVARPLDLSAEDVAKRPDVLVIESGEVKLPGDVHMRDIGLPPGVAYACLAETVVLALEGRYETFTVGRNIEWTKVKEIYQLGLKHGMSLATISGVNGVFTDEDFARVRELALAARDGEPATKGSR
jgi:WS/DGAT/MGAT family acyltransferase